MIRRLLRRLYRAVFPLPVPPCDPETLEVLADTLRADSCAVDIGCNRGSILKEIVRLAPAGRHFAFEPNPALATRLTRTYPRVTVHQMALADRAGEATFHLFTNFDGFSGLQRHQGVAGADIEEVTVKTGRLDQVLPAGTRVVLIKIDVEGAEHVVLSGASDILARDRPVLVFESGTGGLEMFGTRPGTLFDLLHGYGYAIRPLQRDWKAAPVVSRERFEKLFVEGTYMWVAVPARSA